MPYFVACMRLLCFFAILIFHWLNPVLGQEKDTTYWVKATEIGINGVMSATSPNWSAGVANNINSNIFFNAIRNYKKERTSLDNVLKVNVGAISTRRVDLQGVKYRSTKKNIDNVFLDSKYGRSFKNVKWLGIYGGLNFQTQLLNGFTYTNNSLGRETRRKASGLLSPGTLVSAVGFEFKPDDWYFIRLGLAALKMTSMLNQNLYKIRNQDIIAGVQKGQYVLAETGFQFQAGINRNFGTENKYTIKFNYLGFAPYNFKTNHSPLDSRIDLGVVAKITKYVNFNYTLISIFDKDLVRPGFNAWQNSWIIGLGFLYKL